MSGNRNGHALPRIAALSITLALGLMAVPAHAVPSFARQTGMACEACHTVFPELTPFGRQFKLNGYLIDNLPQVRGMTPDNKEAVLLNWLPPLSVQFIGSFSKVKRSVPDSGPAGGTTQNGSAAFPDQASLFYAGRIAPKMGGFIQITYSQADGAFGWDNTDIRFADQLAFRSNIVTYGVTVNNNPTVQDLWNSTPAWGVPFAQRSGATPSPVSQALIDQTVGGNVVGLTAYASWNNLIYAEVGGYRSAIQGCPNPINTSCISAPVINGLAPYWRLAIEKQWDRHALMVGTYGLLAKVYPTVLDPNGINIVNYSSGPTDRYRDIGLDAQYQFLGDDHIFSAQTTYIHERRTLDATFNLVDPATGNPLAANASNTLRTFRVGGNYYYQRRYGASLGYFSITGTTDAVFYPSGLSATGSPDTKGWAAELSFLPWQNVKLALQYIAYQKFNGASSNYDGTGRDASGNNTLYLYGWLAF